MSLSSALDGIATHFRHPKRTGGEEGAMKDKSKLGPNGEKIVAALGRFRDTIEAGIPIELRFTIRRVKLDLPPRMFGPDEVKGIRAMMGVSQPIFGQFLGVDVKTVRSWEQRRRSPPSVSRGNPNFPRALARPLERRFRHINKVMEQPTTLVRPKALIVAMLRNERILATQSTRQMGGRMEPRARSSDRLPAPCEPWV
jgi:DNA-binding XRE family transcriptional regulator